MMTEFQKEIATVIALLAFSLGYFCYAGTAPTGVTAKNQTATMSEGAPNEGSKSFSVPGCILF